MVAVDRAAEARASAVARPELIARRGEIGEGCLPRRQVSSTKPMPARLCEGELLGPLFGKCSPAPQPREGEPLPVVERARHGGLLVYPQVVERERVDAS